MTQDRIDTEGWRALLRPATLPTLAVLLAGVLLHSMNVLLLATIMPSIVADIRGEAMIAWPTTAYLASSIVATTVAGRLTTRMGAARIFSAAAFTFALGSVVSAFAPTMLQVIGGRFLQGFGGGLLSALAYILARQVFPIALLPRVFALLTSVWSISALVGPLVGGVFATYGSWRSAFLAVAALAGAIGLVAMRTLPAGMGSGGSTKAIPVGLIALVAGAITLMSVSAIVDDLLVKASFVAAAIAAMALMVRLNARSASPLLPTDAFLPRSATGLGLWMVLLLSIAFSPVHIYVPVLLQKLHGLSPIAAGYAVAAAAIAWTLAALVTASLSLRQADLLLITGPLAIAGGLVGLTVTLTDGPVMAILAALLLIGVGMGTTWSFIAQRVMARPKPGEGDLAASAVATIQQTGFGLGSALSGIVANLAGFTMDAGRDGLTATTIAVPLVFAVTAIIAAVVGWRLGAMAGGESREPAAPHDA